MDPFNPTLLVLALVPSAVGYVLFTYGRKQARWPQLFCGLALMLYPYFAATVATMIGAGVLIAAAFYMMIAAGL
jgi:hypothetical protein